MRKRATTTSGLDWNSMLGLTQRLQNDHLFRDYLIITMGCYFGLRAGDLLTLKWGDVLDKSEVELTEQKTKKYRKITINESVDNAIKLCWSHPTFNKNFRLDDYIFANRWGGKISLSYLNRRLKFLFTKYDVYVQNASSHTLRKTFGKRIYESDSRSERALVYLSEIFSHSSTATTRKYIGITQVEIANIYMRL